MLVNKIKDKKVNEQGTQLSRLKEALERLKDSNGSEENGETNERSVEENQIIKSVIIW